MTTDKILISRITANGNQGYFANRPTLYLGYYLFVINVLN